MVSIFADTANGKTLADAPVAEFIAGNSRTTVSVRVPDGGERDALDRRLRAEGGLTHAGEPGELVVDGLAVTRVGDVVHALGIRVHGLAERTASLEQAYMELTASSVEYGVSA